MLVQKIKTVGSKEKVNSEKSVSKKGPRINAVTEINGKRYGNQTFTNIREENPAQRIPNNDLPEKAAGAESKTHGRRPGSPGEFAQDRLDSPNYSGRKGNEDNRLRPENRAINPGGIGAY